jgi:hypothetical protein
MSEDIADTGARKRRETQRERVARAIYMLDPIGERGWEDAPASTREDCFACADAAIAAMPEPRIPKEKNAPKGPDDSCRLHAKRSEFAALVSFIEARSDNGFIPGSDGPLALARALREQGVV